MQTIIKANQALMVLKESNTGKLPTLYGRSSVIVPSMFPSPIIRKTGDTSWPPMDLTIAVTLELGLQDTSWALWT